MSESTMRRTALGLLGLLALAAALVVGLTLGRGRGASVTPQGDPVAEGGGDASESSSPAVEATRIPGISDLAATAMAQTESRRQELQSRPTWTPEPTFIAGSGAPEIERITIEDAVERFGRSNVLFVDVRNDLEYRVEHIQGAFHLPVAEVSGRVQELPRDTDLIFYCACSDESTSSTAARQAAEFGRERSYALLGGWNAWKAAGHPVEAGASQSDGGGAVEAGGSGDGEEEAEADDAGDEGTDAEAPTESEGAQDEGDTP